MYQKQEIPPAYQGILDQTATIKIDFDQYVVYDLFHLEKGNGMGIWERYREGALLKRAVRDAREILLFSDITKERLESIYPSSTSKTRLIKPHVEENIQPLDDDAKDIVRYKFAEGNAYFLYTGPIHPTANLIELLKGFSIFKKKFGSNMKLVMSGVTGKYSQSFMQSIETYKFRDDLIMTGVLSAEERIELLSSAYALLHSIRWERFGMPIPMAMKAGVAVLAPENSVHSEMAGMAGMFFDEKDPADIGDKLMRIYRDEQVRNEMIGTGISRMKSQG